LVNVDRVKRKLPSLLVDSSTTKKKSWNSLMRYRYQLIRLKKTQPERYSYLTNQLLADLHRLEEAVKNEKK
jgi:hypothetical protein